MRILGIDLGSSSVKAVEVDSAFGRYEIHEYHELKVEQGHSQKEALSKLLLQLPKPPDRIVVALPTHLMTFRNLHLPTRDRKAIQAGVGFELEDDLPFAIENAAFDFATLSHSKSGTEIHVAATLKKHLQSAIEFWNAAGADPDIITTEAWAFRTLLNRITPVESQQDPTMIIHIGHHRTILYVHHKGSPVLARSVAWGGNDLSVAIGQKYQIPLEQAEVTKTGHAFMIPAEQEKDATQEQIAFSRTLLEPLQLLISEVKQAVLACKSVTHKNVSSVLISGPTSLTPGLDRVLEESLVTVVKPLQALSQIATSGVTYSEQTDATFSLAAALALASVGSDRTSSINLRQGQFSKHGKSRELNLETLKRPLQAIGAIAISLLISLVVQSSVYRSRISETDTQLEKSVRLFFGQISSSALRTYMNNIGTLKTSVNKELTKERELGALMGPDPKSPIDYLKELSTVIPKSTVVDLIQYQVGSAPSAPYLANSDQTVSLSFVVSNPQVVERLSTLLSSKVSALQRSKMEEVTSAEGTKQWKVTFTGKPAEGSYGQ